MFETKFHDQVGVAVDLAPLEVAIIIPTFNERANVERLLERLAVALSGLHWEAIFVDDNSPDGTADLIRQIGCTNTSVRVIQRIGRRGLSSAAIEGMLATSAPILAVIDGDLQHDEMILPQMVSAIRSGVVDIAVGTRYRSGGSTGDWDQKRQWISRIATVLGQNILKVRVSDPMSGFFALPRATLMDAIPHLSGIGFKLLTDILASLPVAPRVTEFPYRFRSRSAGESKLGALVTAQYLALIADKTIGRVIPLRLLAFLSVGALGVIVQLTVLGTLLWLQFAFLTSEIVAVLTAMTSNFFVNNIFTYRDRRLSGWSALRGLATFYAVCSIGAVANIGVGSWVNDQDGRWWLAGIAGTVVGAIWNFTASSFVTWRK